MDLFWKLWQTVKKELENKIPDTKELVKKLDCNAKIAEIENKIRSISALATNAALTTVEDKIPNIRSLVKKKQIMTQKMLQLKRLKRNLLVMIMTNTLLLQNSISFQQKFLIQD